MAPIVSRARVARALLFLGVSAFAGHRALAAQSAWSADHHMHLASADLCGRVGECLETNVPAAVYAVDAVRALDQAGVARGVILSCAYLYGLPSLHLSPEDVARYTRRENEFTALEVSRFPGRLIGFLSVDPLEPSALAELAYWRGHPVFRGLKLHLTASGVDLNQPADRERLRQVVAAAAAESLPLVIHIGGGTFGRREAELFVREILPSAASLPVQIAHAAGGLPLAGDNHLAILQLFADHLRRKNPATEHLLFDLSFVPAAGEDSATVARLRAVLREIGLGRMLFGSDFNVETPTDAVTRLRRLGLTEGEMRLLQSNCAPWACGP